MIRRLLVLFIALFCCVGISWAGPVEWIEVPATDAGQQWWDRGSIRDNKNGLRTVLSGLRQLRPRMESSVRGSFT